MSLFKRRVGLQAKTMRVPAHWKATHFRAETAKGEKLVYCPIGNICSWNPGDYDHRWCHWCQEYFGGLLGPDDEKGEWLG